MWLFSKIGFVSVVEHREQQELLLVRARFKEDIKALRDLVNKEGGSDVEYVETANADYRYRLGCPRSIFVKVAAGLVNEIDYDNFKNAVHGNPVRDKAYMRCWVAMNEAQWSAQGE